MFNSIRKGLGEIFINQHLQTICIWKVFVPFLLIVLIYPILSVIVGVGHPFARAFAHGELLIFSSLILIEAAVELKRAQVGFDEPLRAFALITIFCFGFMKFQVVQQEPRLEASNIVVVDQVAHQLSLFSLFNCMVAILAICLSIFSFLKALRSENIKTVEALEQRH